MLNNIKTGIMLEYPTHHVVISNIKTIRLSNVTQALNRRDPFAFYIIQT